LFPSDLINIVSASYSENPKHIICKKILLVGFLLFRAKRQLNTTRLSVTIHLKKEHREVYLKYGFMKYCTKITKFDFLQLQPQGKICNWPFESVDETQFWDL